MAILSRSTLFATLALIGSALVAAPRAIAVPVIATSSGGGQLQGRDYAVNVGFPYGQEKIRVSLSLFFFGGSISE